MILSELRRYLAEHRRVTLQDMAYRFDTDTDALRGMLAVLERKGRVRHLPPGQCTAGCNKCDLGPMDVYEYVDDRN
ncbi:MAG: FeoC-like transcriptional regulator [Gammaproteobacteria bacterium]|nr:FeoC-like transcriptional regulator [Gammaproteobacteria bacterium]